MKHNWFSHSWPMKRTIRVEPALASVIMLLSMASFADEPAAVSLRVRRLTTVKEIRANWSTSWGSYDNDFSRAVAIEISLRNMKSKDAQLLLEVLFIAKGTAAPLYWVFDRSVEECHLKQSQPFQCVKRSKPLKASVQNYAALGMRDESGGRIEGYIVRVLQGDAIVSVEASSHPLKQIGKNPTRIAEMIEMASGKDMLEIR